ncbi:hypothetical protein [Nonomuraea sp. NPDC049784]|uniref:hypothetical protein n=1 Tax=Nonomuraea sp. NPDC049784 TaxID=3154361 RepID=UPI00340FD527
MGRDDSKEAVLARTENVWPKVRNALIEGIKTAIDLHERAGWEYQDDKHLYQHMIRRKAVQVFKSLKLEAEEDSDASDTSVLAMSGLILYLPDDEPDDVVRIWHIATSHIPKPGTPTRRAFVKQQHSEQDTLMDQLFDPVRTKIAHWRHRDEPNHLIVHWTVNEHAIERLDLVRPTGIGRTSVAVDWRVNLLEWMAEQ